MQNSTRTLPLLSLIALLFFTTTQAQNIKVVTPDNADASAQEIVNMFGGLISVTANDIEAFYLDTWDTLPYDITCDHPTTELVNMDNSTVEFEWTLPSGAVGHTLIKILRLTDGSIYSTSSNTGNATINASNDLYLFIFQTLCGSNKSAADIVIIDKPVLFAGEPCECKEYKKVKLQTFSNPDNDGDEIIEDLVSYQWPNEEDDDYYAIIEYTGGITASLRFHINYGLGEPMSLGLYQECVENIAYEPMSTFMTVYNGEGESPDLGTITFSTNNALSFVPAMNTSGIFKLRRCIDRDRNKPYSTTIPTQLPQSVGLKSMANPFASSTRIQYDLPEAQIVSLQLFNTLGQQVKTLKTPGWQEAGTYIMDLDFEQLPNGAYFCVLKTEEKTIHLQLQKTN